ncbi:phosphate ABC transporter substrate-binding protein PstS [Acidithiobacillus sp. M4-SHS-6]|uniref:phosphate ABC transporter substrate-binding protein PstS n=1 Tax=Acidithiobacillus sp. M4-SHS-6 TaxID=3383024 RepID=UPI0039BDFE93
MFYRLKKEFSRSVKGAVMISALGLAGMYAMPASAATISLLETGSTLLYPLFNLWVPVYTKMNPGVQITTQGTGSGTGIAEAISGVAQIGASDAYMSDAQIKMHPDILNIPLAISIQMINYNLPGLNNKHLKLSGPVLADIYSGKITNWDDAAIAKLNPGVKLPNHQIIPIHRTDGSGDTFIFTTYLSDTSPVWSKSVGYSTTVSWPAVPGGIGAEGNPGMVQALKTTPYGVAYIGISWKKPVEEAKLGLAMLKNRAGNFVLPTVENAKAAADEMVGKTPADERISLVYAPGAKSYPIINYEYAIVSKTQPQPEVAAALKKFLNWAIDPKGGNAPHFITAVNFVPLPESAAELSRKQIAEIH